MIIQVNDWFVIPMELEEEVFVDITEVYLDFINN